MPNPYRSPQCPSKDTPPIGRVANQGPKQVKRLLVRTAFLLVLFAGVNLALAEEAGAVVLLGGALAMLCFSRCDSRASAATRIALFCVGVLCIVLGGIAAMLLR